MKRLIQRVRCERGMSVRLCMTLRDISKSGGLFKRLGVWSGLRSATTRSAKIPRKYIKTYIWHCTEVHGIVGMEVLRSYIFSE